MPSQPHLAALGQWPLPDYQKPVYQLGAAASSKRLLASSQITTVLSISVEMVDMFWGTSSICRCLWLAHPPPVFDFFDPVAGHIHSVEMKKCCTLLHCAAGVSLSAALGLAYLMKYHAMSLLDAHTWTKSCQAIIRPNNSLGEQFIHYEFQLFGKSTVHMVPSPVGVTPDIYEKGRLMITL